MTKTSLCPSAYVFWARGFSLGWAHDSKDSIQNSFICEVVYYRLLTLALFFAQERGITNTTCLQRRLRASRANGRTCWNECVHDSVVCGVWCTPNRILPCVFILFLFFSVLARWLSNLNIAKTMNNVFLGFFYFKILSFIICSRPKTQT